MQKYKFIYKLFLTATVWLSWGCAGKIKKSDHDIKFINSKALIEDKVKKTSHTATIDLFYLQDQQIVRMEVSAVLGYRLGSLVMNKESVRYAVHPQKIFVEGPKIPRTMRPLFRQDLNPLIISAVVLDQDLQNFDFKCSLQQGTRQCDGVGPMQGISVSIQEMAKTTKGPIKKITIDSVKMKLVWVFKSIQPYNRSYNETFVLNQPENYRLITIK